jgi:hypothetical protein
MIRPEDYEGHAIDCVALADGAIRFPDSKAVLLEMAEAWFKLAQYARKNEKREGQHLDSRHSCRWRLRDDALVALAQSNLRSAQWPLR